MGCCEVSPPLLNLGMTRVPEPHAYLIERDRKYNKTLGMGYYLLNPFRDRVAHVQYMGKTQVFIPPDQPIPLYIGAISNLMVVDPYLASYCDKKPTPGLILELVRTALRREVGKRPLVDTLMALATMGDDAAEVLNAEEFRPQGLECNFLGINYFNTVNEREEGGYIPMGLSEERCRRTLEEMKAYVKKREEEKKKKKKSVRS